MADKEIEVFETTAGQITDVLKRLGVPKERMVTVMIEPDDWLTKARQESRRLVIKAGLSDDAQGKLNSALDDEQPEQVRKYVLPGDPPGSLAGDTGGQCVIARP